MASVLAAEPDVFDGVILDPNGLPDDLRTFEEHLDLSLRTWKQEGKRGVWLKIPIEKALLVPLAVEKGFVFHHAEERYLMLTKWLPENVPSTLPTNATHLVGVGAFVLDSEERILVVQEKNGFFRGTNLWKMPTGLVNPGENIAAAAVRETKEETGVDVRFLAMAVMREKHGQHFGKTDLFCLCVMEPLTTDITVQESEIVAARWMPVDEVKAQDGFKHQARVNAWLDCCMNYIKGRAGAGAMTIIQQEQQGSGTVYMVNNN